MEKISATEIRNGHLIAIGGRLWRVVPSCACRRARRRLYADGSQGCGKRRQKQYAFANR